MDRRVALIRAFSRTFAAGSAKIETAECGLPFLDKLLSGGGSLEYGELTPLRLVHRYKLVNVPETRMVELLHAHVEKEWNVCRYFGQSENDVLCFNLDDNHRTPSATTIPEMDLAVRALRTYLRDLGWEPLIVASGRGYHAWCRLTEPIENERLHQFLLLMGARTLASLHKAGYEHADIKVNLYPNVRLHDAVSLRLFGSQHAKTRLFSHVLGADGLLDEAQSWEVFADFVEKRAITRTQFDTAFRAVASLLEKS